MEASGRLVAPAVFKTDVAEHLGQAGSIPVRLRHLRIRMGACGRRKGDRLMSFPAAGPDPRRRIPGTDVLLAAPALAEPIAVLGRAMVKDALAAAQAEARAGLIAPEDIVDAARAALPGAPTTTAAVLNATGVVLHTNLGRAALSTGARAAVALAAGHTDVELDLGTGARSRRGRGALHALAAAVPEAEPEHAANNGAEALALAAKVLACGGPNQ